MESLCPNLFVADISASISFYQSLGFGMINRVPEEGTPVWAMLSCGKVIIMLQTKESLGDDLPEISRADGGSLLFYIQINAIKQFRKDLPASVRVLKDLEKTFYGATEFSILDPNGYVLTFAEHEH